MKVKPIMELTPKKGNRFLHVYFIFVGFLLFQGYREIILTIIQFYRIHNE